MDGNEVKYFMWFDSSRCHENRFYYGPHYSDQINIIGTKLYHTLDELNKISISNTLKRILSKAPIGKEIKIHYLHSSGDLMLRRITEEQAKKLDEIDSLIKEESKLEEKIYELQNKREIILTNF